MTEEVEVAAHVGGSANMTGVGAIGSLHGNVIFGGTSNAGETKAQVAHTKKLKYRADRDEQERQILHHLSLHLKLSPTRPVIFFVHGEKSQCLDAFIERLRDDTVPRHLKALVQSDQIEAKYVQWPSVRGGTSSGGERVYKESLTSELEISPDATEIEIVDRIAQYKRPVMLSSVHTEVSGEDEETTIRAVLDMWAKIVNLRTGLSLLVFVALVYAEARPGFLSRLRSKPKISTLAQRLSVFANYLPDRLRVVVLPELVNVTLGDTEHWVRTVLRPADIEDALRRAREAFGSKQPRSDASLPMEILAKHLEALVPKDRHRLRLQ